MRSESGGGGSFLNRLPRLPQDDRPPRFFLCNTSVCGPSFLHPCECTQAQGRKLPFPRASRWRRPHYCYYYCRTPRKAWKLEKASLLLVLFDTETEKRETKITRFFQMLRKSKCVSKTWPMESQSGTSDCWICKKPKSTKQSPCKLSGSNNGGIHASKKQNQTTTPMNYSWHVW